MQKKFQCRIQPEVTALNGLILLRRCGPHAKFFQLGLCLGRVELIGPLKFGAVALSPTRPNHFQIYIPVSYTHLTLPTKA